MARIYHLLLFIATVSAQDLDFTALLLNNELTRGIERAIWADGKQVITIFSDFNNASDRDFFQRILPWLVDNIGNDLKINYRFRNSGRSAGHRMCALRSLRNNAYLQAEFLRCEAQDTPVLTCVDQSPITRRSYNRCLNKRVNQYVRDSQFDFDTLISDQTPLVLLNAGRELTSGNPMRLLRLICQAYGRVKPAGCLRPSALPPAATSVSTTPALFTPTVQNNGNTATPVMFSSSTSPNNFVFPGSTSTNAPVST